MKSIEIINAITMIFPFVSFIKHRRRMKRNRAFTKIVACHIPIAGAYHLSKSMNESGLLTRILKFTDLALIHSTSFVLSLCTSSWRRVRACLMIPINALLVYRATLDLDNVGLRYMAMLYENAHLLNTPKRIGIMAMNILFYQASFKYDITHSLFHVALYSGYNEMFHVLGS